MEDIIKARIVFEKGGASGGGGLIGAANGSNSGGSSLAGVATGSKGIGGSLAKMAGYLGGIYAIAKASPRLQATLQIWFKALMIPLRIIGDVMSAVLRPLGLWLLKLLIPILRKWNNFGKDTKDEEGGGVAGVTKRLAGGAATGGVIGGSIGGPAGAALGAMFGGIVALLGDAWRGLKKLGQGLWKFFVEDIPGWVVEAAKLVEWAWNQFAGWFDANVTYHIRTAWANVRDWFQDTFIPGIKEAWHSIVTWFDENLIQPIKDAWSSITNWFDENIISPVKKAWKSVATWFNEAIIEPIKKWWKELVSNDWFLTNIVDKIKEQFGKLVEGVKSAVSEAVDWMLNKVPDWIYDHDKNENGVKGLQTGGYITKEGLHYLHAGETVVPAHMSRGGMQFTPHITINANISSEMDLDNLANRLANIMNSQVRRQVSYRSSMGAL